MMPTGALPAAMDSVAKAVQPKEFSGEETSDTLCHRPNRSD